MLCSYYKYIIDFIGKLCYAVYYKYIIDFIGKLYVMQVITSTLLILLVS